MVEFSKIVKKMRQDELLTGRRVSGDPSRDWKHSGAPSPRPVMPQEESSIPDPVEPTGEDGQAVVKEIKPLFTQRRSQEVFYKPAQREPAQTRLPDAVSAKREAAAETLPSHESAEAARVIYEKMFVLSKALFSPGIDYAHVNTRSIVTTVAEVAGAIAAGDEKLIELALMYIVKEEEFYLDQHSVNVCIISLLIGAGANYEMGRLIELGIAAFLHDIGMTQFEDMASLTRKLTQKEYDAIKQHVQVGDAILKKINHGLSDTIIAAQFEIHERLDGSGYPAGKKSIHDYARIVAVADAFESMIHPRPFRPRHSIMDVYKRIFDAKTKYDQNFIKILVDRVGFFPNGSFVQLNTKEVGKVVRQNPRSPLRPIVRIIFAEDGQKLYEEDIKEVNLIKYPTIYVKKCFLEESEK
jgi:HD-GYP domain-containing protein (c-di-GMP phosphodiesterase class II)